MRGLPVNLLPVDLQVSRASNRAELITCLCQLHIFPKVYVFNINWAFTNSLAQKLSGALGFYGFSAEQNSFTLKL